MTGNSASQQAMSARAAQGDPYELLRLRLMAQIAGSLNDGGKR